MQLINGSDITYFNLPLLPFNVLSFSSILNPGGAGGGRSDEQLESWLIHSASGLKEHKIKVGKVTNCK